MAARGRPPGLPKSGGRVKSSLDKQQRQLVSAELAHSILATFEMLGGVAGMVEWAADNQTVFYTQILSRLMPAPQKSDDPDIQINQQFNTLSDRDAAIRVAFAIAKAAHEQGIDITTQEAAPHRLAPDAPAEAFNPPRWSPPIDAPDMQEPTDMSSPYDADRARWASEIPLTPQERTDQALVRETRETSIKSYPGGGTEQGYGQRQSSASKPTTVNEIRRRQMRDKLL